MKVTAAVLATLAVGVALIVAWTIYYNRRHPCPCNDKTGGTSVWDRATTTETTPPAAPGSDASAVA